MAGNVFFNIIPAHWELINAKKAGREPDPLPGVVAKQRSVHNNYFTLPVLFTMIAGHFAFTYGAEPRLARAARDHVRRRPLARSSSTCATRGGRSGRSRPSCVVVLVALAVAIRPDTDAGRRRASPPSRSRRSRRSSRSAARPAIRRRRPSRASRPLRPASCSRRPRRSPPGRTTSSGSSRRSAMPLGNVTGMTDEERTRARSPGSPRAPRPGR